MVDGSAASVSGPVSVPPLSGRKSPLAPPPCWSTYCFVAASMGWVGSPGNTSGPVMVSPALFTFPDKSPEILSAVVLASCARAAAFSAASSAASAFSSACVALFVASLTEASRLSALFWAA